jgi:FixJ family two-component response regulator
VSDSRRPFLNKPCEEQELVDVIADCTRQYELVRAEKDLLQQTFVGAVRVLTDVIDAIQPQLAGDGGRG